MAKITRHELEGNYLNYNVEVTLFDNSVYKGKLQYGDGFFESPKLYNIKGQITFRLSHVKKIRRINEND